MRDRFGVWSLGLIASALIYGCGQPEGPQKRQAGSIVRDLIVQGSDYRLTNFSDAGFDLIYTDGFESEGEEKIHQNRVKILWPVKLPAMSTWKESVEPTVPSPQVRASYDAGNVKVIVTTGDDIGSPTSGYVCNVEVIGSQTPISVKQDPRILASQGHDRNNPDTDRTYTFHFRSGLVPFVTDILQTSEKNSVKIEGAQIPSIKLIGPPADAAFVEKTTSIVARAVSRPQLPIRKNGFAPFGLSNSLYFGHTFWDMDVWVLPSMLFLQPDAVRSMNRYRLDRAAQAEKNAGEFFKKPNTGMMFPWESSVTGKETVRASSVKEHHISGSVLWGLNLSEQAGIAPPPEVGKVARGVAKFFENRSITGVSGREIKDVMSPDENHIGDNDLYTNLLAQWAMNGRKWDGPTKFKLPKDANSFLTYDNDKERGYKQAAAVLSIFPLQYPPAEKQARVMMERFEGKVSKNGPAMSDAIHATIWARLGEKEKAYDAWKRSWEPFVKGPQMLFSEKRSSERTYFYTGAAGCLNTVIYGFAGFRFDDKPLDGAVWKKKLKSGWWLSCKPCLPPKWESLMINPMIIDGQKYRVEITPEKVTIQPASGS